jgi:hypothetical protein
MFTYAPGRDLRVHAALTSKVAIMRPLDIAVSSRHAAAS